MRSCLFPGKWGFRPPITISFMFSLRQKELEALNLSIRIVVVTPAYLLRYPAVLLLVFLTSSPDFSRYRAVKVIETSWAGISRSKTGSKTFAFYRTIFNGTRSLSEPLGVGFSNLEMYFWRPLKFLQFQKSWGLFYKFSVEPMNELQYASLLVKLKLLLALLSVFVPTLLNRPY